MISYSKVDMGKVIEKPMGKVIEKPMNKEQNVWVLRIKKECMSPTNKEGTYESYE